jgi:DNA repair exonuclease SbcCD nuclease subunit
MKFAHISDSHLGGWRQPALQQLNLESFRKAIEICILEKVEFILFTGDLFDSSFPPIEILKETFAEFRKLKEAGIKCFIIAGSHDYSVSGKTFLDVLEKAGFCETCKYEESDEEIILKPCVFQTTYIYGYPGKKSGLEVQSLKKIKIQEPYESYFRILMLHTTVTEVTENLPVDSIPLEKLPKADFYALGHVHIDFEKEINDKPAVYGGPTFPNNFKELEELKYGSFYIVNVEGYTKIIKKELRLKDIELVEVEVNDALKATQEILTELEKRDLKDKIVLLKVFGKLSQGKTSDIKFQEIQEYIENQNAFAFLKNISKLETEKKQLQISLKPSDMEKVEETLIKKYEKENPSQFNNLIFPLIESLSAEKQEGEKNTVFENRLFLTLSKVLGVELV